MFLLWDVTNACNQKCRHCYNSNFINNCIVNNNTIDEEILIKLISLVEINKIKNVVIAGGEPLTVNNISTVIEALVMAGVSVSLTTNGTLMNPQKAELLANSKLTKLAISLESVDPQKYNKNRGGEFYKRFIEGVENIQRACRMVHSTLYRELSVTVLSSCLQSEDDIGQVYNFARQYRFGGISFQFPISAGENWNELLNPEYILNTALAIATVSKKHPDIVTFLQYKKILVDFCNEVIGSQVRGGKKKCPAADSMLYMNNKLEIYPCVYQNECFSENEKINPFLGEPEKTATNFLKTSYGIKFGVLRDKIATMKFKTCQECAYYDSCFKMCPYEYLLDKKKALMAFNGVCKLIKAHEALSANSGRYA